MEIKLSKNKIFLGGLLTALFCSSSISRAADPGWLRPRNVAVIATGLAGAAGLAWLIFSGNSSQHPGQDPAGPSPANQQSDTQTGFGPASSTGPMPAPATVKRDPIDELFDELNVELRIGDSPCRGKMLSLSGDISIAQIKVLSQFEHGGGGDASCGYQALKNSIIMLFNTIMQTADLEERLYSLKLIQELFGEHGIWRSEIIRRRVMNIFHDYISSRLQNCLRPEDSVQDDNGFNTANIRSKYQSLLGNYCARLLHTIFTGHPVHISYEDLLAFLAHAPIQIEDIHDCFHAEGADPLSLEDLQARLRNPEIVARYINQELLVPFDLRLNDFAHVKDDYNRRHSGQPVNIEGEWVDETELTGLIEQDPQAMGPGMFTVIRSTTLISPDTDWSEEWHKVQQVHTELVNPAVRDYIHCFIVGTMELDLEVDQTPKQDKTGHWYALIVHKVGGRRYYYIADSANHCRLYSQPIIRIIAALEGPEIAQRLVPTAADAERFEIVLQTMLAQTDCPGNRRHRILDIHELYRERGGNYEAFGGHDAFIAQMAAFLGT